MWDTDQTAGPDRRPAGSVDLLATTSRIVIVPGTGRTNPTSVLCAEAIARTLGASLITPRGGTGGTDRLPETAIRTGRPGRIVADIRLMPVPALVLLSDAPIPGAAPAPAGSIAQHIGRRRHAVGLELHLPAGASLAEAISEATAAIEHVTALFPIR